MYTSYFFANQVDSKYSLIRIHRKTFPKWKEWTDARIVDLKQHYELHQHNLDLSASGFLRTEVYKAEDCIFIQRDKDIVAFVYFFTSKRPSTIYISLMASFERGMGSVLIHFLTNSLIFTHKYISLRATSHSVGFYIKLGFEIFDFISMEDYVNGTTDKTMTNDILQNLNDKKNMKHFQEILIARDWMPPQSEEFPLLKLRSLPYQILQRKSSRLQSNLLSEGNKSYIFNSIDKAA